LYRPQVGSTTLSTGAAALPECCRIRTIAEEEAQLANDDTDHHGTAGGGGLDCGCCCCIGQHGQRRRCGGRGAEPFLFFNHRGSTNAARDLPEGRRARPAPHQDLAPGHCQLCHRTLDWGRRPVLGEPDGRRSGRGRPGRRQPGLQQRLLAHQLPARRHRHPHQPRKCRRQPGGRPGGRATGAAGRVGIGGGFDGSAVGVPEPGT
jgi:hypothetical protein